MKNIIHVFSSLGFQGIIGALVMFAMIAISKAQSIDITLSNVENPGNEPDPITGFGQVDYCYRISTFEITIAQYTAFLNAVAKTDKYRLYSPRMEKTGFTGGRERVADYQNKNFQTGAGILRSGSTGKYSYSVIGDSGNNPITYITWFQAARFCNWLHNGQPENLGQVAGSTEAGAYDLKGIKGDKTDRMITRNPNAKWWIPNENEWYKAAYYDPELNDGSGGYWLYATRSNVAPGNVIDSGTNQANYITNATFSVQTGTNSNTSLTTPVGSFLNSTSYYGTYDQNGNVWEWYDPRESGRSSVKSGLLPVKLGQAPIKSVILPGIRGGCWDSISARGLQSRAHYRLHPSTEDAHNGFRVATLPLADFANQ